MGIVQQYSRRHEQRFIESVREIQAGRQIDALPLEEWLFELCLTRAQPRTRTTNSTKRMVEGITLVVILLHQFLTELINHDPLF
jgi:hypothetical protein